MTPTHNINLDEIFKIRLKKDAGLKHEVIKLLIVLILKEKYKKILYWIKIYTEYPTYNERYCDVYFENQKTKEVFAYEIRKNISDTWMKETKKHYENWDRYLFETFYVTIEENKLSSNIEEMYEKLKTSYII